MNKLLAIVLLSALSLPAFALEPKQGVLIDVSGGYTPSILAADGGASYQGFIGYKFNYFMAVEAGYVYLLRDANSGSNSKDSIWGPEVAGYLLLPINNRVTPFLRAGFSKFTKTSATPTAYTSIQTILGPSYGVGLQFYEADHLSLRVGYNAYYLESNSDYYMPSGVPVTTSNYYVGLTVLF